MLTCCQLVILKILPGGVETGFRKVEPGNPVLLVKVKGEGGRVVVCHKKPCASSLNSGDVFVLATAGKVFKWEGRGSNVEEKRAGEAVARALHVRGPNLSYRLNDSVAPPCVVSRTRARSAGFPSRQPLALQTTPAAIPQPPLQRWHSCIFHVVSSRAPEQRAVLSSKLVGGEGVFSFVLCVRAETCVRSRDRERSSEWPATRPSRF